MFPEWTRITTGSYREYWLLDLTESTGLDIIICKSMTLQKLRECTKVLQMQKSFGWSTQRRHQVYAWLYMRQYIIPPVYIINYITGYFSRISEERIRMSHWPSWPHNPVLYDKPGKVFWFPAAGVDPPRHGESMPHGIKKADVPNKTKIKRTTTPSCTV